MGVATTGAIHGGRNERILLAIGGECTFACLVALVTSTPPAIEVTVAFGIAVAIGLEAQARHLAQRAGPRRPGSGAQ